MLANPVTDMFIHHFDTAGGKEKLASIGGSYVQDKLRENSFCRKILTPKTVTKADCQVSVHHDTLVYIDEIAPNSKAMSLTFRGVPKARYIKGDRYEIPFFSISSEKFEKAEQELLAYRMPITKIIEDYTVKDIQAIEDHRFLIYVEQCVQTTGQVVRGQQATDDAAANGVGTGFRGDPQRADFVKLFRIFTQRQLVLEQILINESDWDSLLNWGIESMGGDKVGETAIDGWKWDKVLKKKVVRSIKTDILKSGNIYGFCDEKFIGKFLILNATKFYIDKVANMITWWAWEDIGMGFGNVASMAKLECYNGQGSGNNSSDAIISEEDVGSLVNNQVAAGVTFPHVTTW